MPKVPKFTSSSTRFGDDTPRRRIVVSTYLTQAESDAMVAKARAARMTQREYLKQCLDTGFQECVVSDSQVQGATL